MKFASRSLLPSFYKRFVDLNCRTKRASKRPCNRVVALAASAIFSCVATSHAEDSLFDLSLEELASLPVTGATLSEQSLYSVPSAVTVLNAEQIERLGVRYLYELLNFVPGFQSQRAAESGLAYGYSVRGRRNSNQSKETLLVLDGMILNDGRTDAANGSVKLLSVDQIDRIEVIRGPGSVLYGSGAYSGVINIITKARQTALKLAAGSEEAGAVTGLYHHDSRYGQWDVYAYGYGDGGQDYRLTDTYNPAASVDTQDPYQSTELRVRYRHQNVSATLFHYYAAGHDFYSIESISNRYNQSAYHHTQAQLRLDVQPLDGHDMFVTVDATRDGQQYDNQQTAQGALVPISTPVSSDPLVLKSRLGAETLRVHVHDQFSVSDAWQVQMGVQWRKSHLSESGSYTNYDVIALIEQDYPVSYYGDFSTRFASDGEYNKELYSAYVQPQWSDDENQVTLGLRYDEDTRGFEQITPRLGWVHGLSESSSVKLLYGEAFRSASLVEGLDPNSPILRGNAELKNETIKTTDLVYVVHRPSLNYQLGLYHNRYENPILIEFADDGVRQHSNGAALESAGVEFEMLAMFMSHYSVRVTGASVLDYPDAFFRESQHTGSVALSGDYAALQWTLATVYHGEREQQVSATQRRQVASGWQWQGSVRWRHGATMSSQWVVQNLLNRPYESVPQGASLTEGVPARGRAWWYGFTYRF